MLSRLRASSVNWVMERQTELNWVARLKSGDPEAFEAVYEAFRPRIFSFLVRLCFRRDVAEDLLEETFLRLVLRAQDLRSDSSLAAWLFTVARNLHATWCRRRTLHDNMMSGLAPYWPAPRRGETPFEATARSETLRRLEAALARLALPDREVILLVAVEELTPFEAACALGLAPEALRKRLQRARERLAVEMDAKPACPNVKAG